MNDMSRPLVFVLCMMLSALPPLRAQSDDAAQKHIAAARAAGEKDHPLLVERLCSTATTPPRTGPRPTPTAADWHIAPMKVFDNLYYVGEKEYSAWAVKTSEGIILIDTIFDYSVEQQVVEGLKKLGLDAKDIKYAIVSHGHRDHSGGARYLQEKFDTRILMGAEDWDLLDRNTRDPSKPKRDMVVTDGMKLTLGDTTLTLYLTPGHTAGTVSTLIPVKDRGKQHLAAEWGGTAFNFAHTPEAFQTYIKSAERFRDIAVKAGADVVISNHTAFDNSKAKMPALAKRGANDPNPYAIGKDSVKAYLTVASECAKAMMAGLKPAP